MTLQSGILLLLRHVLVGLTALTVGIGLAPYAADRLVSLLDLSASHASVLCLLGVLGALVASDWLLVRLHEERAATELRARPLLGVGAIFAGAGLISVTLAILYTVGSDEVAAWSGHAGRAPHRHGRLRRAPPRQ